MKSYFPINIEYFRILLDATTCLCCIGPEQCRYQIPLERLTEGRVRYVELLKERTTDVDRIFPVVRYFLCPTHEDRGYEIALVWSKDRAQRFGLDVPDPSSPLTPPSSINSTSTTTTTNSAPLTPASSNNSTSTTALSNQLVEHTLSSTPVPSDKNISISLSLHISHWPRSPFATKHIFTIPILMAAGTIGLFAMWYSRKA